MLIEIPDPEIILSVVLAFLVGLFSFYLYHKLKPYINHRQNLGAAKYLERLQYYEKQLIDMKIRLDALNVNSSLTAAGVAAFDDKSFARNKSGEGTEASLQTPTKSDLVSTSGQSDVINRVLELITNKAMTSRDIQITIGRTREHTSRLMKKLFEDGYVQRRTATKPYIYAITEKGRSRIGLLEKLQ